MAFKFSCFLLLLCFSVNQLLVTQCFNVKFEYLDPVKVEENGDANIDKREMAQFFDQASYSFNGFDKLQSVPVISPIDICLMKLETRKYAASLHKNKNGSISLEIFQEQNGDFESITDLVLPNAIAMDCKAFGSNGYIAVARNISDVIRNARDGSPIYEITKDHIRAVQYFPNQNLRNVFLRVDNSDLYLLQSFENTQASPNLICPYYKWSGTTFTRLCGIPCNNAKKLEPFSIDYESYVAVANYADQFGRKSIDSVIYKFNRQAQKFQVFQKIRTNGAVDIRYFRVPLDFPRNRHFLIIGNSQSNQVDPNKPGDELEADSIFYVYERGQFEPFQSISLYAVRKFLPLENLEAEKFLLLVACANQDIKIYNLNDWRFELSNVQYTEGALGKGIAEMRSYEESDNNYLIIANENMVANETNIFKPIFKQEDDANVLRQEIIQWTQDTMSRLQAVAFEKLKQEVQAKLEASKKHKITEINETHEEVYIDTAYTKTLIYPALHMNRDFWSSLRYAKKALDVLEAMYPFRRQQRDTPEALPFQEESLHLDFKELQVRNLQVRRNLKASRVNGVDVAEPHFDQITAKKIMVTGTYIEPKPLSSNEDIKTEDSLTLNNLQVNGTINGIKWQDFLNNTLKNEGFQIVRAPVSLDNLQAETVIVTKEEISKEKLNTFVSTTDGSYIINRDIQFAAPIQVSDLTIKTRLNNIQVKNGDLDVLLKKSSQVQTIEGAKSFENLRVSGPITLSGKVAGDHLRSIVPGKAVHEPLILKGNYTIENLVTIGGKLNASDIILQQENSSLLESLQNSIHIDQVLDNLNMKFEAPLSANNSDVSFINGVDLQDLVLTNITDIQVIEGFKLFADSLQIDQGFAEVKLVNGFDIEDLETNLFMKNTNQTIKVPMKLGLVIAKGLESQHLSLNGRNLNDFLTKSTNQTINNSLKVDSLRALNLETENLNTNGQIFGAELQDIYHQKVKNAPDQNIFHKDQKFDGTLYIKNLYLNSKINGRDIEQVEKELAQLEGNVKYVGNFVFHYPMNITNLVFEGSLNGIPKELFGKCWLQKTGSQNFTAPQTFAGVKTEKGLLLEGMLNNIKIEDLQKNVYSINQPESLPKIVFESPIEVHGSVSTKTLNGLSIPEDILLKNSLLPQYLEGNLNLAKDLEVDGLVNSLEMINGMPLNQLNYFLNGDHHESLHVEQANFTYPPTYMTLNQNDLEKVLNQVWLINENVVVRNHVEIAEGHFKGLLDFQGAINNINLEDLQKNYFSLSKPQDITTELVFKETVNFTNHIQGKNAYVYGPIVESKSGKKLDLNDFVSKSLKTSGLHIVSGKWSFREAFTWGNLNNVHVNGLNLAKDVLRNDVPLTEINIPKQLSQVKIKRLFAAPGSLINNVDLCKWLEDTVFLYENRTIWGTTTIDSVTLFNDFQALYINNKSLDITKLMLKDADQILQSDLIIENFIPLEKRILTNNIENLHIQTINHQPLMGLLENIALYNSTTLMIKSPIRFERPVYVGSVESNQEMITFKKLKRSNREEDLQANDLGRIYNVDHFKIVEIPLREGFAIENFSTNHKGDMLLTLKPLNGSDQITYLQWNWMRGLFEDIEVPNELFEIDLEDPQEFDILSKFYPIVYATYHHKKNLTILPIHDKDCVFLYGSTATSVDLYCISSNETSNGIFGLELYMQIPRPEVQEIIPMKNDLFALRFEKKIEILHLDKRQGAISKETFNFTRSIQKIHYVDSQETNYFAVVCEEVNSYGNIISTIELIKSSTRNSGLEKFQSIQLDGLIYLTFSRNYLTKDLFLHVLQLNEGHPSYRYSIYGYEGAMGFVSLGEIVLPAPMHIKGLESLTKENSEQDLVVLIGASGLFSVQSVVKEI